MWCIHGLIRNLLRSQQCGEFTGWNTSLNTAHICFWVGYMVKYWIGTVRSGLGIPLWYSFRLHVRSRGFVVWVKLGGGGERLWAAERRVSLSVRTQLCRTSTEAFLVRDRQFLTPLCDAVWFSFVSSHNGW